MSEGDRRGRWAARLASGLVLLAIVSGCAAGENAPPATPDTGAVLDASAMNGEVALDGAKERRRQAAELLRKAKRELKRGHDKNARRLATRSRQLRKTQAARTVIARANAAIAKADAAARERKRIARDAKTCTAAEKAAVRDGAATPPGCDAYNAEQEAQSEPNCDPNYEGACLKPDSSDYDCRGGSGDGPDYTGPVRSVGSDPYDLDRDGDGYACESS